MQAFTINQMDQFQVIAQPYHFNIKFTDEHNSKSKLRACSKHFDMDNKKSRSPVLENLLGYAKILFGWCCVPFILIIVTPFVIWKLLVLQIVKLLHPDLVPISVQDVNFILDNVTEQDNLNKNEEERVPLSVIGSYLKLTGEKKMNMIELKQIVLERVIIPETDYSWKLQSYFVRFCGSYFWEKCHNFNIENHLKWANLTPGNTIEEFLKDWSRIPFAPRSPLWEIIVVDADSRSVEYIAIKVHHSLGDGLSIFEIMLPLLDARHNPRVEKIIKSSPPKISSTEKVKLIIRLPWLLLAYILMVVVGTPDPFRFQSQQTPSKKLPDQRISLCKMKMSDVKSIQKKQKTGFLAVLMCVYAGAIRRFLVDTGCPVPKNLLIPVPQPWPGRPKNFIGNSWSMIHVPTPINISDPLHQLEKLQSNITEFYNSGSFLMCKYLLMNLMYCLPSFLQQLFKDFVCVRYSLSPILAADEYGFYDGRKVQSIHAISGLIFKSFKLMALTLSFNNVLTWTISGPSDIFKSQADLDILVQKYIPAEVDYLLKSIRAEEESRLFAQNRETDFAG